MFRNPAWRRSPIPTAVRCAWSLVLKRFPPRSPLIVPFDEGRSRIYADMRTAFGRYLYRFRDADPDLCFVRHWLEPGQVFVDGGAHVGMFTLVAARAVGKDGMVVAFEPNPETFAELQRNIALNRLTNVMLHDRALGDKEGDATFAVMEGDRAPWSHLGEDSDEAGARCIRVCVTTLDRSIPRELWSRIGLIKLDLEGAEYAALIGASSLLDTVHPPIFLEFVPQHFQPFGVDGANVLNLLRRHGYVLLRRPPRGEQWVTCSDEEAYSLDPERPNLLAVMPDAAGRLPHGRWPGTLPCASFLSLLPYLHV